MLIIIENCLMKVLKLTLFLSVWVLKLLQACFSVLATLQKCNTASVAISLQCQSISCECKWVSDPTQAFIQAVLSMFIFENN